MAFSILLTSCESKQQKVENAQQEVNAAEDNLKTTQAELNAEYPAFKTDAELQIAANDQRIAELKVILNKPGKLPFDEKRKMRIAELEEKNAQLRSRLYGYEKERSDWEAFKREYNSDMQGLNAAFKDLSNDNVK